MAEKRKTYELTADEVRNVELELPFTRLEIKKTTNDEAVIYARADGEEAEIAGDECIAIAGGMGAYDELECRLDTYEASVIATADCTITVSRKA